MSFKLVLVLLALAGILGIVIGYFLRWLVSLGQKGSVELQIKQMLLEIYENENKLRKDYEKITDENLIIWDYECTKLSKLNISLKNPV